MAFPKIGTSQATVNNRPSSYNNGTATINFSYDNSGNMTAAGSNTYQWDGANRLKSVNGGTSGSYGFDGNGKRVKKSEGGASTYYVYSSVIGSAVMEVNSSSVQRAYVMNGGSVVAQRNPDGDFYWLHADHLGSGRKMTNTSGNLTYRAEFDPYGKLTYEWSATPNQNTKKFTGYERDTGSGLDYAQARMYSSEWGRFLSPDPKGFAAANKNSPLTLNRYSYTEGNPINFIDPEGTDSFRATSSRTFDTWRGWVGPLGGSFGYNNAFGNFFGTTTADFAIDYSYILDDLIQKIQEDVDKLFRCYTPNSIVNTSFNDTKTGKPYNPFIKAWGNSTATGDDKSKWVETGGFIFWDRDKDQLLDFQIQGKGTYKNLPTGIEEFDSIVNSFRDANRDMVFLMFYHTHPNGRKTPSGYGGDFDQALPGMQSWSKNDGVGLIIYGEGFFDQKYHFYYPSDNAADEPRKNQCLPKNSVLYYK